MAQALLAHPSGCYQSRTNVRALELGRGGLAVH